MGAVKFVANGADVMRPGIVDADRQIKQGELISIIDVKNRVPMAVGIALASGENIMSMDSGRAIKNVHWVGDEIWSLK